jgi:FkbM family methyltransferase
MQAFKTQIRSLLKYFNIGITRYSTLEALIQKAIAYHDLELIKALPIEQAERVMQLFRQDLFVLSQLNFKTNGFFVEFGATNGVDFSNTYLLETEFNWQGVLAEPATCWHKDLLKNRCAAIELSCVWKESDATVTFNEVNDAALSTINKYSDADYHKAVRTKGKTYDVRTISLNHLLLKHHAPTNVDYLSIDTEGSEFDILAQLDFDRYSFQVITCEHNFTPMREKIFTLLSNNGYRRVYDALSQVDDWYVKQT